MTLRAVILGILGALFIAGFGYVDSQILRSTLMVGHFFPVVVFGGLVVLTIGVGACWPLLAKRVFLLAVGGGIAIFWLKVLKNVRWGWTFRPKTLLAKKR